MTLREKHNANFGKLNPAVDSLPEEAQLQAICVQHIKNNYPEISCFHCPNTSASKQIFAKIMGLRAGFPDIMLIDMHANFYFFEFKSEKGVLSEAQKVIHQELAEKGLEVTIIRKFGEWQLFLYKHFAEKKY
jgi:hypothetical protein